jgi:hypothetical protein
MTWKSDGAIEKDRNERRNDEIEERKDRQRKIIAFYCFWSLSQ